MSVTQIIEEIDRLPETDRRQVAEHLQRVLSTSSATPTQPVLRHKSFEAAADRIFRENKELFRLLAQ